MQTSHCHHILEPQTPSPRPRVPDHESQITSLGPQTLAPTLEPPSPTPVREPLTPTLTPASTRPLTLTYRPGTAERDAGLRRTGRLAKVAGRTASRGHARRPSELAPIGGGCCLADCHSHADSAPHRAPPCPSVRLIDECRRPIATISSSPRPRVPDPESQITSPRSRVSALKPSPQPSSLHPQPQSASR